MSEEIIPFQFKSIGRCVDDVKGGELLLDLVRSGRKAEIEECAARKGHEIRPRWEASHEGGKRAWIQVG